MKKKFEILVVDDDLKNIQVGINFLKHNDNYHLVFATSGQQALDRLQEKTFDLVLLDIIMPVMDGYEVCRRIKADPATRNIPVIFLTAKHESDSLMKGFELGGADYITKPFNAPELHARVKTHLELHASYKAEIAKLSELLTCSQQAETIRFLAGGVSHDCNNFITSISPAVQLLRAQMDHAGIDSAPFQDLMDGISHAAAKVVDLLETFSHFSARTQLEREVVDMNEVVSDLRKVCKGAIHHTIRFEARFFHQPALIYANKLHVEQVLMNMLINAQHAILAREDGEERGEIIVTIEDSPPGTHNIPDDHHYLLITVEDNGIGMPPEVQEKIFTQYFTTRRKEGGTGLGLAVAQSIICAHDGHLAVESSPGKGARFTIALPAWTKENRSITDQH